MYRHFGSTGIPMAQVENASASGSTAVRQACIDVAAGLADVAIAVGVDKPLKFGMPQPAAGLRDLVGGRGRAVHALRAPCEPLHPRAPARLQEQFALVAVKNSENGALNPNAQRQKARSLEEVLAPPLISGPLTRLQCCPVGEGAAAVIVASDAAIARLGLDPARAVRVLSSASRSETVYRGENFDAALTRETVGIALHDAGVTADDLDVVELHERVHGRGAALHRSDRARSHREGRGTSGGGPVPCRRASRRERLGWPPFHGPPDRAHGRRPDLRAHHTAEGRGRRTRQHAGARTGLAHMVGVGAVCVVHVLQAP